MVCGPLLQTLNTSGPLLSYKILCPNIKSIEDQKQKGLHRNLKGFFPEFDSRPKEKFFTAIRDCIRRKFGIYCINSHCFVCLSRQLLLVIAPWLRSCGSLGGANDPRLRTPGIGLCGLSYCIVELWIG